MSYASVADMIARFGEIEMVRLSTPRGMEMSIVQTQPVQTALDGCSATIDSYVRKRYAVPLGVAPDVVPPEINRCCCILARYELAGIEGRDSSERVRDDFKAQMAWLRDIADGRVVLALAEVSPADESYAQASTRCAVFDSGDDAPFSSYSGAPL